jgi:hypothetical protein
MHVWYRINLCCFNAALQILKYETDVVLVVTGLLVLISLLPAIPAKVKKKQKSSSQKSNILKQFLKNKWHKCGSTVPYSTVRTVRYNPAGTEAFKNHT